MNGQEFIRRVRKLGRKKGIPVSADSERGKGSHGRLYYGDKWTTVKHSEIGKGLFRAMCVQLGIDPDEL